MPPWFVEKNIGIQKFKHDPSLSDEEIAKIAKWVDSGAPRGNPADMPKPLEFDGYRQVDDRRAGSDPAIDGRHGAGGRRPTSGATSAWCRPGSPRIATCQPSKCARSTTSRTTSGDQDGRRTLRLPPHDVRERRRGRAREQRRQRGRRQLADSRGRPQRRHLPAGSGTPARREFVARR